MNDINNIVLIGRLVKNSELKYTASGTPVCEFSIAVNDSEKINGNWKDWVSFFNLAIFNNTAENLSKYLLKGKQVCVAGKLKQDRWEKEGKKNSNIKIKVLHVQLLGGNESNQGGDFKEKSNNPVYKERSERELRDMLDNGTPTLDSLKKALYEDSNTFEDDIPF